MDISIVLVEDEDMVRKGMSGLLQTVVNFDLLDSFASVESFLDHTLPKAPAIVVLDINIKGGMSGLDGIKPILQKYPEANIIMLTTFDDSDRIFKALCAGASAYVTKRTPFQQIAEAIRVVASGGSYMSPTIARKVVQYFQPKQRQKQQLTPRQEQIVEGIVRGDSYDMIAANLMISLSTVQDHIKKIYRKLQIHSKGELIQKRVSGEV